MTRLIDDFGFRYPGVKKVEHVYFYSVSAVGDEVRRSYLHEANRLGREFCPIKYEARLPGGIHQRTPFAR